MSFNFGMKRILVTGASSGIGKGITEKLSQSSAKVIALDINKESLQKLREQYNSVETICVDLTSWKDTEKEIKKLFPLDGLVNNAGVAFIAPLTKITEEEIDKTFDLNVKAVMNITRIVAENMKERKTGSIVNISSQASKAGLLNHAIYCASKGAIDAFTRVAALELGPYNVRVNSVNPTVVMTDLGKQIWSNPDMGGPMLAKIPLRRFAEVEDVSNAVVYLLSDMSSMVNGINLPVDGGFLAG